jgi:signal transduction histidine kinase
MYTTCHAQGDDSSSFEIIPLKQQLSSVTHDTARMLIMAELSYIYAYTDFDSSFLYGQQCLKQSNAVHFTRGIANALAGLGNLYLRQGDYPKGLQYQLQALEVSEENHFEREQAISLMEIGYTYQNLSDYTKSFNFHKRAKEIYERLPIDESKKVENEIGLSNIYMATNRSDSALTSIQKLYNDPKAQSMRHVILQVLCDLNSSLQNYPAALKYFHEAIDLDLKKNDLYSLIWAYNSGATLFKNTRQADSCIYYAKKGLSWAQKIKLKEGILVNSFILSEQYEAININEAFYYRKIYDDVYQKLYGQDKVLALQKTLTEDQERQRQVEIARVVEENKRRQYLFVIGLAILGVIATLLYRNNFQQKKAKKIVDEKNKAIEQTLSNLKEMQSQLIQSEKMASLGELTAGIAHEIQNPLNFVNNFSEVNKELLVEMKGEMSKGNLEDATAIANDVIDNEEKINHHGKRADAIVKGMLQHSRSGTRVKESTNINALAGEYLRLAYHGLRAKDNSFNVTMKTEFDETIGNINLIPQDIGRVLLNLYNNAFYATNEKSKQHIEGYEPTVSVSTKKTSDKVFISIKDNGNGIPQKIVDKVFQPFFTTKPTGQGTGLGLSLSYDIVKAHGGEIKVNTKENEGTEFTIMLPA